MMSRSPLTAMALVLGVLLPSPLRTRAQELQIRLGEPLEVGRDDLLFGSVTAACEDEAGNFFVLDQLEHRVYGFSREGNPIGSFGRKGQGPGDFQRPGRISLTPQGHLAVADEMYLVSFLETDGKFLRRVKLESGLAPGYIGEDRFYAWRWIREGRQQIMLDGAGNVLETFHSVARGRFSVSAPDESGRQVMFNFGRPPFSPGLMYAQNGGLTALAVSDAYHIRLLDGGGKTRTVIERDVASPELSRDERRFFEEEFKEFGRMRGWPQSVVRDIIKKLPRTKVYFDRILLSPKHVFVCRITADVTREGEEIPLDVFTTAGEFLGTAVLPEKPLFVSRARMYFKRSDQDGNVWLAVRDYFLE